MPLRVGFAGTPEFAALALKAIVEAGYEIPVVFTQPDRPAGRGLKLQASAVKQVAQQHGLRVEQPQGLRLNGRYADDAQAAQQVLQEAQVDIMVVAAYGLILPAWFLQTPRLGCINIHASLLPRWRGAAPIHRAIEAGDAQTGITIMAMDEGLDTGDMLMIESMPIAVDDTTMSLHDRLAALGARMVVDVLADPTRFLQQRRVQPEHGVIYAHKIDKAEALLRVHELGADVLARKVRAFQPMPGTHLTLDLPGGSETLKVGAAVALPDQAAEPGVVHAVSEAGIDIGTAKGVLRLTHVQRPGGKRMSVEDLLRGWNVPVGARVVRPEPLA